MKIMGLRIRKSSRVLSTLRMWNISWDTNGNKKFLNGLGLLGSL